MQKRFCCHRIGLLPRLVLTLIALIAGAASAPAILTLRIDPDAMTMTLVGTGPYVDLTADPYEPYRLYYRSSSISTGLNASFYMDEGFANVGGLDSVQGTGDTTSAIWIRDNGKRLIFYLQFPSSEGISEGYLTGGNIASSYADQSTFISYIGDGSGVNGKTLIPYMDDNNATFPQGGDTSIAIVLVPEPLAWTYIGTIGVLSVLLTLRRRKNSLPSTAMRPSR